MIGEIKLIVSKTTKTQPHHRADGTNYLTQGVYWGKSVTIKL